MGGVDPIILIAGFVAAVAVGTIDDCHALSPKVKLAGQTLAALLIACSGVLLSEVKNPFGPGFIVAVGTIDDCHALSPKVKLAGQTLAALLIACSGVLLSEVKNPFGPGFIEFGVFAYPITIVYLLLFMNAINLIDGLDGLCAGIVAIALGTLIVISIGKGKFEIVMLSAILLGGVLAFLRFNIRPASIFMGDSGSLFLGLSLGVLSLVGVMRTPYIAVLLAPLVVASIPLLDTLGAVVRRLRRHQPFDVADKSHIHHRLMATSLSNERIVYLLWAWTGILGCLAIMISSSSNLKTLIIVLVAFVVTFVVFWQLGVFGPALTHHFDKRFKGSSSVVRALNRLGSGSKDEDDGGDTKGNGGE